MISNKDRAYDILCHYCHSWPAVFLGIAESFLQYISDSKGKGRCFAAVHGVLTIWNDGCNEIVVMQMHSRARQKNVFNCVLSQ